MGYTAEPLELPKGGTIPQLLLESNVNDVPPETPSIIDGVSGNVVYTYAAFRSAVKKVSAHLRTDIGISSGTVVGIMASNSYNYPVLVHGVLAAGGVVTAFNPLYQAQEISHYLNLARPAFMIVDGSLASILTAGLSIAQLDYTPELYLFSSEKTPEAGWKLLDLDNVILSGAGGLSPQLNVSHQDLAFICFSSGTTGPMKGVYLTHGNIVANIFQHRQRLSNMFGKGNNTVAALITPFFHILGLGVFICQYICQGIPIVVFPKFDLPLLLQAIPRDQITHINIVPPIALRLLQSSNADVDFTSVKCLINAAAPLNEVVSAELSRRMGCKITQWYGMTEASPSVISQHEDEVGITGTVGRLLPGMSMKVVDSEGRDCGTNKSGELLIQGPNLMRGYVESPNADPSDTFSEGFFKTGDIGYVDENDYVFLVGRSKELIKVKGNQVAPAELEALLLSHAQVSDAAVRGIYFPDQETEYPAAYITVDTGVTDVVQLTSEVESFVNKQVVKYKWLRGGVHIVPLIPRNASGKILRHQLPDPTKGKEHAKL
ncbi:hypothetical protein BDW75DRAFT_247126 [Aspergillus navahoensis]